MVLHSSDMLLKCWFMKIELLYYKEISESLFQRTVV